ncbi:MAG: methyltransferase domain-containing protein [Nannocystaceae bacterium]
MRAITCSTSGTRRLALIIGAAAACHQAPSEAELPLHYPDKNAAIARFNDPERSAWAMPDRVVDALPELGPAATVADIGAGSGYFARRLATRVPKGVVYAVDVDSDFKRYIETNREAWGTPNIEPRLAVYENPLLPAGQIDLVFLSNTYTYIDHRTLYFREVHTALRAGGSLVIVDFRKHAACGDTHDCPPKARRIGRDTALTELTAAGFVLTREETFLPHQYFLILTKTADKHPTHSH